MALAISLSNESRSKTTMKSTSVVNPISLEIFRSALTAIAEEMGAVLMHSSYSPNIKERRDFSCALFDTHGRLVAQAAHIPVHLGSMPDSVAAALVTFDLFAPGDIIPQRPLPGRLPLARYH